MIKSNPDALLVVGDVNSTIAGTLVAKKLGIRVINALAKIQKETKVIFPMHP